MKSVTSELAGMYWHALLRGVPLRAYEDSPLVTHAWFSLTKFEGTQLTI